jgi:hypothetical protein
MRRSIQTTIVDVALAETSVEDEDALEALCTEHVRVTREAIRDPTTLLDFDEYLGVGRAL